MRVMNIQDSSSVFEEESDQFGTLCEYTDED